MGHDSEKMTRLYQSHNAVMTSSQAEAIEEQLLSPERTMKSRAYNPAYNSSEAGLLPSNINVIPSAERGTRTPTARRPSDFKSDASTYSAIPALHGVKLKYNDDAWQTDL